MSKYEYKSMGLIDYQLLQDDTLSAPARVLLYYRRFTSEQKGITDWRPNEELAAILNVSEASLRKARSRLMAKGKLARFNIDEAKKGNLIPDPSKDKAAYMAVEPDPYDGCWEEVPGQEGWATCVRCSGKGCPECPAP